MTWYTAQAFFDGKDMHSRMSFRVEQGKITELSKHNEAQFKAMPGTVAPGYIDTQVNGGGGILFNQYPSLSSIVTMRNAHLKFGTTSMLPTLITDSHDIMQRAADAIAEAINEDVKGILGLHFEGPHLSAIKRGIHPEKQVRPISDKEIATITRKDIGQVLLTVAPENVSPDVIRELVAEGVIVSLGHSDASFETAMLAIEAGASGATHLFNAMSGMRAREPGVIGAVLADERVYAGLISDLHHVHKANCKLAFKLKTANKLMLVTDAMAHVGSDISTLPWQNTHITRRDGRLTTPDGTLAGSCLSMSDAVKNCCLQIGIALPEVLKSASSTPARFLNKQNIGHLREGADANFVVLDESGELLDVYLHGDKVK